MCCEAVANSPKVMGCVPLTVKTVLVFLEPTNV
jgi:hypothetical protein